MNQQRWEALFGFMAALVALAAPVAIFFLPEKESMVQVLVVAAGALITALAAFVANWTAVSVIRTRSEEREAIRWHDQEMMRLEKMD